MNLLVKTFISQQKITMNIQDKLLELQLEEYFKDHLWNENDDLIDQFRILIENDFMKTY